MKAEFIREVTVNYKKAKVPAEAITSPAIAARLLRKILPCNSKEHFLALYLDGANKPVSYNVVSTGTANSSVVHPREVFQPAILAGAVQIVIAHNHPSGQTLPSQADRGVTKRLKEAGNILGIPILDHVIVTDDDFYSFSESESI